MNKRIKKLITVMLCLMMVMSFTGVQVLYATDEPVTDNEQVKTEQPAGEAVEGTQDTEKTDDSSSDKIVEEDKVNNTDEGTSDLDNTSDKTTQKSLKTSKATPSMKTTKSTTQLPYKDLQLTGEASYDITATGENCSIENGTLKYDSTLERYNIKVTADDDLTGTWAGYDNAIATLGTAEAINSLSLWAPFQETIAFNLKLDDRLKLDESKFTLEAVQKQFAQDNPEWAKFLTVNSIAYDESVNAIHIYTRFLPDANYGYPNAFAFIESKPSYKMIWSTPEYSGSVVKTKI